MLAGIVIPGPASRIVAAHFRVFAAVDCFTREGSVLSDCTLTLFQRLRRRGLIASSGGGPYRATRLGLASVRAQPDNR